MSFILHTKQTTRLNQILCLENFFLFLREKKSPGFNFELWVSPTKTGTGLSSDKPYEML